MLDYKLTTPNQTNLDLTVAHRSMPGRPCLYHSAPLPQFIPCGFHKGMPFLVTFAAKRFQIARVVRAVLGQFEDVVTMTVLVCNRIAAVLARTTVALVNVLFEFYPHVNRRATVPGETDIRDCIYCECSHTLPLRTLPLRTVPGLTSPSLIVPDPHHKVEAIPHPTLPCHAPHPRTTVNPRHKGFICEPQT